MSQTDRIYQIHRLLANHKFPVSLRQLTEAFEVSPTTIKPDIEKLRDMGAPIPLGNHTGGYYYDPDSPAFELPGLWFNQSELYTLLATEQLLEAGQPGVLGPQLGRLKGRVRQLLGTTGHDAATLSRRIHLQPMGARPTDPEIFGTVAGAVLAGHRLELTYHSRYRDEATRRHVHPYRLNHSRDNWYLLAGASGPKASGCSPWTVSATAQTRVSRRNLPTKTPWTANWAPPSASSPARPTNGPYCGLARGRALGRRGDLAPGSDRPLAGASL